ncbi:MAG: hypothetical protein CR991_02750 [Proteobacteria bacterium]|nr:MAG: hypothetical protein CR991_02750 [Pseudomonadota bacterium]
MSETVVSATNATVSLGADIRRTLWLALPLIMAQLFQVSAGLVDTLIAGHLGSTALGAVGVGSAVWIIVMLGCMGLSNALAPMTARLLGSNQLGLLGHYLRQGLWLAFIVHSLGVILLLFLSKQLAVLGIDEALVVPAQTYLGIMAWTLLPSAMLVVARNFLEASENTHPVLLITLIGLIVNVSVSVLLGLGYWGLPRLGLVGIAWGSVTSLVLMAIVAFILLLGQRYHHYQLLAHWEWPRWKLIKAMLALSIPIALSILFEAGLFSAVSIQMGVLGTTEAAANAIALQLATYCFMLPLGLSFVVAARMGRAYGQQDHAAIRQRLQASLLIAITMACVNATLLIVFKSTWVGVFTDDTTVIALANSLVVFAAIFQLSDTTQVTFNAALRGLHDTRVPMLINGFSYWILGFCVGYVLAHVLGYGARGLWIGLIFGLSSGSVLLGIRLWVVFRRLVF